MSSTDRKGWRGKRMKEITLGWKKSTDKVMTMTTEEMIIMRMTHMSTEWRWVEAYHRIRVSPFLKRTSWSVRSRRKTKMKLPLQLYQKGGT